MKRMILGAKEESRGVFWVIDDALYAFPFEEGEYEFGYAKSGNTYNHERLWEGVKPKGCNKPYNYYPRGRVEFTGNGRPVIYLNPNISDTIIPEIKVAFGLRQEPVLKFDFSDHYRCYLD